MDVFEAEPSPPKPDLDEPRSLSVEVDGAPDEAQQDDAGASDDDQPAATAATPTTASAVDSVFDVEESGPSRGKRKKIGKSFKRQSSSAKAEKAPRASDAIPTEAGQRMCQNTTDSLKQSWNRMTDKPNLLRNYRLFLGLQLLMYLVWVVMYSGLVIPMSQGPMTVVLFFYLLAFAELIRRLVFYKKRCEKIKFEKGVEYEFYTNAIAQLKFHGWLVLLPLILLVLTALTFTYTVMQGLNYYNVRTPSFTFRNHTQSLLLNQAGGMFTGGSGCSDDRALNYDSRITDHDESRCEYVRCHEDVYQGSNWPGHVRVFVPIYLIVFCSYMFVSLIVSYGHLRYFEDLYLERRTAMPFMREMWRKAVTAYTGHHGSLAVIFGPGRLRMLHGILIVTQGLLAAAMTVGKLSMTDLWFVEFDVSVLLLGYECGRHSPHAGYVEATGLGDIYKMTQRLNWHRQSMYHYFMVTTFLAYLSVSGAYRIHPGTDYQHQPIANTPGFDSDLICHSDIPTEYRSASWVTIALLFVLLVGVSVWLSLSHYIQYQSVKRDHATMLGFALAFRSMLERRRKRVTYAYYDDTGPDLCPPGGFPAEYMKTDPAKSAGEDFKRGKLFVNNQGIRFMPASGIEGIDDDPTDVRNMLAAKQEMGQPPRLVITLSDDSIITIASQSTRSIKKSVDKIMSSFGESDGVSNGHSSDPRPRVRHQPHISEQSGPARAEPTTPAQSPAAEASMESAQMQQMSPMDSAQMQQLMQMQMQQQMMMMSQMQDPQQMAAMQQQLMGQVAGGASPAGAGGKKND